MALRILNEEVRAIVMKVKYVRRKSNIPDRRRETLKQFADRNYLAGLENWYLMRIGYTVIFHEKACVIDRVG